MRRRIKEAVKEGPVRIAWDGKATGYDHLPAAAELDLRPDAAYAYFTSNETIEGVQFADEPSTWVTCRWCAMRRPTSCIVRWI